MVSVEKKEHLASLIKRKSYISNNRLNEVKNLGIFLGYIVVDLDPDQGPDSDPNPELFTVRIRIPIKPRIQNKSVS
jgi:hypothetical protein